MGLWDEAKRKVTNGNGIGVVVDESCRNKGGKVAADKDIDDAVILPDNPKKPVEIPPKAVNVADADVADTEVISGGTYKIGDVVREVIYELKESPNSGVRLYARSVSRHNKGGESNKKFSVDNVQNSGNFDLNSGEVDGFIGRIASEVAKGND